MSLGLSPEDAAQEGDIIDDEKESTAPQTNYSLNTSTDNVKKTKLDKFDSLFDDSNSNDLPILSMARKASKSLTAAVSAEIKSKFDLSGL